MPSGLALSEVLGWMGQVQEPVLACGKYQVRALAASVISFVLLPKPPQFRLLRLSSINVAFYPEEFSSKR